jgi:hypothetical protein
VRLVFRRKFVNSEHRNDVTQFFVATEYTPSVLRRRVMSLADDRRIERFG